MRKQRYPQMYKMVQDLLTIPVFHVKGGKIMRFKVEYEAPEYYEDGSPEYVIRDSEKGGITIARVRVSDYVGVSPDATPLEVRKAEVKGEEKAIEIAGLLCAALELAAERMEIA